MIKTKTVLAVVLFAVLIFLTSCAKDTTVTNTTTNNNETNESVQIANPASVFCVEKGFNNTIETLPDGSQIGYCDVKTDAGVVRCEEWAYFRGECPAAENNTAVEQDLTPVNEDTKFLVNFPWTAGESWTLTTNFHDENCLDFVNFENNDKVVAAADGEVLLASYDYPDSFNTYSNIETNNPEDMGNFVVLKHKPGIHTLYFHLRNEATAPVQVGDIVKAGDYLGLEGNTGFSHGKHLHFCVTDVSIFPPGFITIPSDKWGFAELNGSNVLELNKKYVS